MAEEWTVFVPAMADEDNGGKVLGGYLCKKMKKSAAIHVIQPLGRFVEDEEFGAFDQGPGDEHLTLLGKAQASKRHLGLGGKIYPGQPLPGGFDLGACHLVI